MNQEKINEAKEGINDALLKAKNPFVLFDGKIDSLVTIHLIRKVCAKPVPVLFIDTTVLFDEIYLFVGKMQKLWGLSIVSEKNDEVLKTLNIANDREECCFRLKTEAIRASVKKHCIDFLFAGVRVDKPQFEGKEDNDVRVNPVALFKEEELWEYIESYNLPYCSLYDKGYKNIDCAPCTQLPNSHDEGLSDEAALEDRLRRLGYL